MRISDYAPVKALGSIAHIVPLKSGLFSKRFDVGIEPTNQIREAPAVRLHRRGFLIFT